VGDKLVVFICHVYKACETLALHNAGFDRVLFAHHERASAVLRTPLGQLCRRVVLDAGVGAVAIDVDAKASNHEDGAKRSVDVALSRRRGDPAASAGDAAEVDAVLARNLAVRLGLASAEEAAKAPGAHRLAHGFPLPRRSSAQRRDALIDAGAAGVVHPVVVHDERPDARQPVGEDPVERLVGGHVDVAVDVDDGSLAERARQLRRE